MGGLRFRGRNVSSTFKVSRADLQLEDLVAGITRENQHAEVNFSGYHLKLDPQIIGNAGLYYCCYRLSLFGWNVMPTARNARGVDIVAYSQDATCKLAIQVKALSKRYPVPLGTSLDKVMGDFWIIVNNVSSSPSAYILLPSEVRKLAHRGEKEGRVSFWLQPKSYDQEDFKEKWGRIGRGEKARD